MLQHINLVICTPQVERFKKGDIIMQAGDSSVAKMYILLKGRAYANTENADKQPNEEIYSIAYDPGDFFGETALFLGQSPAMRVTAQEDSLALVIDRKYVAKFFAEQPEATIAFIEELCRRIQQGAEKPAVRPAQQLKPAVPEAEFAAPSSAREILPASRPPQTATADPIINTSLFPKGHEHYELTIIDAGSEYLFLKSYTCPICDHDFKSLAVKASKLIAEHTDSDLRVHYTGVEPLHFDVVICPNCWYSALAETFKDGVSSKKQIDQLMKYHKEMLHLKLGEERNSFTVFAGYYLAIICAPKCYRNYDAIIGKLWLKLSRLYDDCQNEKMVVYATEQALKGYMDAFEKSTTPPKQNQQLFYIIGELSLRINDLINARKFFFQAKTDKEGSPVLARQAEDRIEYLRQLMLTEQA